MSVSQGPLYLHECPVSLKTKFCTFCLSFLVVSGHRLSPAAATLPPRNGSLHQVSFVLPTYQSVSRFQALPMLLPPWARLFLLTTWLTPVSLPKLKMLASLRPSPCTPWLAGMPSPLCPHIVLLLWPISPFLPLYIVFLFI